MINEEICCLENYLKYREKVDNASPDEAIQVPSWYARFDGDYRFMDGDKWDFPITRTKLLTKEEFKQQYPIDFNRIKWKNND